MFFEFLSRDEFYKQYIQLLSTRMAFGNVEMENPNISENISSHYTDIYNNMEAFKKLIESNKDKITPYDIVEIANKVNNGVYEGFRRTQVEVGKAKNFYPIPANLVIPKMYMILDNYYNIWNELPIYEKEARLHIELVRAQPFEDGNKRTARIIMNYNFCKQNVAPVIIGGQETDKYFEYIDNYDIEGFAKYLEAKSSEELEAMRHLYGAIFGEESLFVEKEENSFVYVYKKQKMKVKE